jgi:hypothetical protein
VSPDQVYQGHRSGRRTNDVGRSLQRSISCLLPAGNPPSIIQRAIIELQACRRLIRVPEKILESPEALYKTRFNDIVSNFLDLVSENICKDFQSRRILSTLLGRFARVVSIRIVRGAKAMQGQVIIDDSVPFCQLPSTL